MKLERQSELNRKFLQTMQHEFALCEQAFDEFFILAGSNIMGDGDYSLIQRLYSAYSRFVVHLYEFYVACFKRDQGSMKRIDPEVLDMRLTAEVEKLMRNMCSLIENGRAPDWVNDISYYKEPVPQDFGEKFRSVRNNAAHVDPRRAGGGNRISLKEFLDNYHKFLFFLFDSARSLWSPKRDKIHPVDHVAEFDLRREKDS